MIWEYFIAVVLALLVTYAIVSRKITSAPSSMFFMTLLGVVLGLSIGALISLPLARLQYPFGVWLPIVVNIFSVALVTTFFYRQREAISQSLNNFINLITSVIKETRGLRLHTAGHSPEHTTVTPVLLDTSVIIDGRILDLANSGFLWGRVIVPRFVLDELQAIADSEDNMRRNKGRRGLEILNDLRRLPNVQVEIVEEDIPSESDVDSKIVKLTRKHHGRLMTVDYNLNRVAQIQNVVVMNVNELTNALRPVVLPGEKMKIRVIQTGKDEGQGVGYLEDGTMVVVEGAAKYMGKDVMVSVTRVFQTVAGKMIFAILEETPQEVRTN